MRKEITVLSTTNIKVFCVTACTRVYCMYVWFCRLPWNLRSHFLADFPLFKLPNSDSCCSTFCQPPNFVPYSAGHGVIMALLVPTWEDSTELTLLCVALPTSRRPCCSFSPWACACLVTASTLKYLLIHVGFPKKGPAAYDLSFMQPTQSHKCCGFFQKQKS